MTADVVKPMHIGREWLGSNLVGVAEIAARAGFSRPRAHALSTHSLFPEPVAVLAATKVWLWPDVQAFLALDRKPGRPRRTPDDGD